MAVQVNERERQLAIIISRFKGRSKVLTSQLGIHKLIAKRIYKQVNGHAPESGLSPKSTDTTFQTMNRIQSSLLLNMYEQALARIVKDFDLHLKVQKYELAFEMTYEKELAGLTKNLKTATASEMTAFETSAKARASAVANQIMSSQQYREVKSEIYLERSHAFVSAYSTYARICGEQARLDINRFDFLVRDSYKTTDLKSLKKIINWTRCKKCKAKILRKFEEISVECPHCTGGIDRSKNLVGTFRDKALNRSLPSITTH